ncbi:LicD family-domain-containing protein [Poronia punctata]|nr:LicD family-domain-containing protein [Poronia punctata]
MASRRTRVCSARQAGFPLLVSRDATRLMSSTTAAPSPTQKKQVKYFHEPGWDVESGHYDSRYFQGKVPYEDHRPVLRHLIRSYLTAFREIGAETWLAHGSLLGWWWNGHIMPWDYDLDVQVSVATLRFLSERYNQSIHEYNTKIKKTYLLDINPHYDDMTKGNGANIIDARWIDTSNGMFIDITGLRERDLEHSPGVWSCKNNHRYRTTELWPLRRTEFEGVEAWIPYAFDKVLVDEYGPRCLVVTEWAGHRWNPELREWIKVPKPPKKEKQTRPSKIDSHGNLVVYEEVIVEA